jgi:cell division GTPase FtsZ
MDQTVRVMVIITGVKSSQISGEKRTFEQSKQDEMSEELGIEYIEED